MKEIPAPNPNPSGIPQEPGATPTEFTSLPESQLDRLLKAYNMETPGQLAKHLDKLPISVAENIWYSVLLPRQLQVWEQENDRRRRWYEAGANAPFGIRKDFARFLGPQEGEMIVDIAGGRASQIPYIVKDMQTRQPDGQLRVLLVDANPLVRDDAEATLAGLGKSVSHFDVITDTIDNAPGWIFHDFQRMRENGEPLPTKLRAIMVYGLYQPMFIFNKFLNMYRTLEDQLGIPTDFTIAVLNPNFDPKQLKEIFETKLAKELAKTEEGRKIIEEAKIALPNIVPHGVVVRREMPIWSPEEIITFLKKEKFQVQTEQILEGQTTLMRIMK